MPPKEELAALRQRIDRINEDMIHLFNERMALSDDVARVKRDGNMGIVDERRENDVLEKASALADEAFKGDAVVLMSTLMAMSKRRQRAVLMQNDNVLLPPASTTPPTAVRVGHQGVPGAWSEMAAMALYPTKETKHYEYFEDVFHAVKSNEIAYGILPIENSQTGAIGEVYDLLRRHGCFIVGQTWVDVRHCLMVKPETTLSDIRTVLSHPEGFRQCHEFLKSKAWDAVSCRNTAVAAEMVAASPDNRTAAIGSRRAAERNGLTILSPDIMDSVANKTRFIAISNTPEYDDQCDTISVTFSTAHKSGALCGVLQSFTVSGINLSRIESRPASAGKYRFFADLQANITQDSVKLALNQAAALSEYFEVLGCYRANP